MPHDCDHHHHGHHPCLGISTNIEDYFLTRRQFLSRVGMGLGALGLATMLDPLALARQPDLAAAPGGSLAPEASALPRQGQGRHPHLRPRRAVARRHVGSEAGADPDGQPLHRQRRGVAMASPFKFKKYGKSGIEVSELFARTAAHADDLAVIRSMYTDIPAHEVATMFMNTGSLRIAKPSLGSWVVYGLGTENQNLPGFISLRGNRLPVGGAASYGSAFLPGVYQGTSVNTSAKTVQQMIQNIRNAYVSPAEQRRQLDFVQKLNALHAQNLQHDAALEARIETVEIAFRMQTEATDAFDISKEPADTRAAYGDSAQGKQLLIARRLVERGVRFVQVWHGGWDHHQDLEERITEKAGEIDQPLAALLADLKQRGLLDDTLVVWGGEFGRKPTKDRNGGDNPGRDHNAKAFSIVMAGGGVKGGQVHGATDEFGARRGEGQGPRPRPPRHHPAPSASITRSSPIATTAATSGSPTLRATW